MKCSKQHHPHVSFTASVRVRLTFWYLAVMAFIMIVFGGSLYATQTFLNAETTESSLEAQLYQDSQQFAGVYQQALKGVQSPAGLPLNVSSSEMVLLLGPDGRVLDSRGPLNTSLTQQLQTRGGQTPGMFDLVVSQSHSHGWWGDENTYRVLLTPILNQNARVATLMVGLPRKEAAPLFAIWLFWGTMALLVAAIGGYWLAGKALRPVKMITRTANEINATDLRRRLHLQRRDEFGALAATFDRMLARLEAAFKRQTQFTADASHELRTPLTIIGLEINRALTQLERPEEYRQVLQQIQVENEQMMAMVNSLLLLARADTSQLTLDLQEVDLSDLALASVERLLPLARQYQMSLATGDLPETLVRGDPQYLSQMLTNLIENAIKYSGSGKRVLVELAREVDRWAVVRVQDNGPGIAEEHLPWLFERFYRADKARSRRQKEPEQASKPEGKEPGGAGLGLSIVQWIVQAHGGEIRVESAIGAGSLFEVRLPLLNSAPENSNENQSMMISGDNMPVAPAVDKGKEPAMSQVQPRGTRTVSVLRVLLVCEAVVFLFAAALHTGAFGVPQLIPAMVVEGLCGIGCAVSAYLVFTRKEGALKTTFIVQLLVLAGVLLGVVALLSSPGLRTVLNLGLHGLMLVLIFAVLALFARPTARKAFTSDHPEPIG